jgi:archaemetzincin
MKIVGVLHLVPIYCGVSRDMLVPLAERLSDVFRMRVEQHPPGFDPELAFDATRGQYNSRILLAQLLNQQARGATRVLGVAGVDLFIPVLTFVFGEAQLDGSVAVVSTFRLNSEIYGLPADRPQLFERLCKEAIHELGHTYNLLHCHAPSCVMNSSTLVDAIDQKSAHFCDACRERVRQATRLQQP